MAIFVSFVHLGMIIWRILEVSVLNTYFNSLKKTSSIPPEYDVKLADIFQGNMIATIQDLLHSLALIFGSLENNIQED